MAYTCAESHAVCSLVMASTVHEQAGGGGGASELPTTYSAWRSRCSIRRGCCCKNPHSPQLPLGYCHSPPFGRHSMAISNEIPCVSARARVRRCRCELDLRHRPLASRKKSVRGRWLGRSKWPIIGLWRSLCAVRALTNLKKTANLRCDNAYL